MSLTSRAAPRKKRVGLCLLLSSLVLTVLLAAGLSRLALKPGLPLPSFERGQLFLPIPDQPSVGMGFGSFAGILVVIAIGVCLLVLLIRAARGIPWKPLLAGLWSLMWKLALALGVVFIIVCLLPRSGSDAGAAPLPPPRPLPTSPLGPVPVSVIWAAGIAMGALLVALSLRLVLSRRRAVPRSWAQEASRARQALLDGHDPRDVIIRCYTNMAAALQEERGIERELSMTAGEFESLLVEKGISRSPVHGLTGLFESARYSCRAPTPSDVRSAVAFLDSILENDNSAAVAGKPE